MALRENLRDLPSSLAPSAWIGALAATVISFSAPVVIIQQASEAAGIGVKGFGSWLAAAAIGAGVASIGLSLFYRMPIMCAWSTPMETMVGSLIARSCRRADADDGSVVSVMGRSCAHRVEMSTTTLTGCD